MIFNAVNLAVMACAFILLAKAASRDNNAGKFWVYSFLAAFVFAISVNFTNSVSLLAFATGTLINIGLSLLVAAFLFRDKIKHSKPFTFTAIVALVVGGALLLLQFGFGASTNNTANSSNNNNTNQTDSTTAQSSSNIPGRLIVELGPDDNIAELSALLKRFDARAEKAFPGINLQMDEDLAQVFIVEVSEDKKQALKLELEKDVENVDAAESELVMSAIPNLSSNSAKTSSDAPKFLANDPQLQQQWGFIKSEGNQVHEMLQSMKPKKTAIVAIVDTGVDASHEDISEVWDNSPGSTDGNGHGTHCAGIAGAMTNNGVGVGSYNWGGKFIKIRGYKALGDSGGGSSETVAQAILDAARDGADVISLSLGGYSPTPPRVTVQAVNFALKRGCILIVAAGNSNMDASRFSPANIKGVITVGALDQNLCKAKFSNTNSSLKMPIAAPGVDILSLKTGGDYVSLSGTSMATPMVAGLVGVMRSLKPDMKTDEAYKILKDTGVSSTDSDKVGLTINSAAALNACK